MNLTVKARVILGFFTISVLLLIISGVSLINLRSLQHDVGVFPIDVAYQPSELALRPAPSAT